MSNNIEYLPYFRIYFLWHEGFSNGSQFANYLFDKICGDRKHPLLGGLGIPIYFRSSTFRNTSCLRSICLNDCVNSAIFVFIDDKMVICESWQYYIEELWNNISSKKPYHNFYPVAFTPAAYNLSCKISHINFIKIYQEVETDKQKRKLLINVLHECCRQLKKIRLINNKDKDLPSSPVKLFLSHAKFDGLEDTKRLRKQIEEDEVIKTFFDTLDILPGSNFQEEIENNLKDCALLIFQTDAYASSYWCRWEVLTAKKYRIPILLINAINMGEERSFPYLGNIPTVRWQQTDDNIPVIIAKMLLEVLRYIYFPERVKKLQEIGRIPSKSIILPYVPELLTQLQSCQKKQLKKDTLLIYPDPPLADDEMEILKSLKPNIKAWTPSQPIHLLTADARQKPLSGKVVGISISNSPDLEQLGFSDTHLKRALIEVSRHLLAQGACLAYGGDLRPGGFTQDLVEMAKAYNKQGNNVQGNRIFNFLAWPLHLNASIEWQAQYKNEVSIRAISLPEDIKRNFEIDEQEFLKPEDIISRYVWMRCLTAMREKMTLEIDARIILGGQVSNYKGALPGIAEESYLAINHSKPLFVLGAFGGCAKVVGEALIGNNPEQLTLEWQIAENNIPTQPTYAEVVNFYNEKSSQGVSHLPIDYTALVERLSQTGLHTLNNHLSEAENRTLFYTEDLDEMIFLILKGLQSLI